ncbi:MAG: isocitrate/isopropylmalate dehydrogenase family protein [Gemmatimonadetes bacterium]|nr:isocitrate/isopropylmalate dehydrogenase family protein [Gemmatimonadota bacterium]NNF12428.1 isocitrate/isopropylmalate dehydrogenase family protein [Gemmatimonadota bacterium]NNL29751.1 isocitrate/isopropylmalate dehydrogenase family protein [Gemmatimonadota bacterium]
MPRIALIPGDGIGKEVVREARRVLEVVSEAEKAGVACDELAYGAERFLRDGVTITDDEFAAIESEYDAVLLGALGDPRVPSNQHAKDILLGMRFRLDLYVNFRPCSLLAPELSPLSRDLSGLRLEIFRENTEGEYTGMGGSLRKHTADEVALEENIATRMGVERIVTAAFEYARAQRRTRVTLVDKSNVMRHVGGLWRRVFEEVGETFPEIERDAMYVDAMAMDLVRRPERYQVLVASNLFGDIISDLAAEITGGLGLAPSANIHPGKHALFEPVHGSAPDIAGTRTANPLGAIRCVGLLLDHLGHPEAGARVEAAAVASFQAGCRTPDLGGDASTEDVGTWIVEHLQSDYANG